MAGTKRSYRDEDAYTPIAKRRDARSSRSDKNDSSAPPLRKSVAKDGHFGTRKTVIIDISGDEEHPATNTTPSAKAIMKNLPQDSISGDFPRFREGSVYIIIDPRSSMFQYRLHRTTLSRVSPLFAKFLRMNWPEASEALKTRATDAYARFDLRYSYQHKKWVLTRTSFTVWKSQALFKAPAAEDSIKRPVLCSKPNTEVSAVILKPTSRHESDRPKHISTTPAILSSGIVAAQITIIDVTKDGSHNSENSENTFVSPAEGSAAEHHAQQIPAEQEQLGMCDNSVQVNHKDDSLNSAGHSFAKQIVAEETEKNHLIIVNEGPDQLAVELEKSKDDMAIKAKAEDSITIISSSGNEETQVSATTGEHETYNQQKNISSLVSVGISLEDPAVESAKFEDVSTLKAEEDKSLAIKSPSTLSINQPSAETSAHQALGKQDIIAPPKLVAIPGPPLELCEAYNNLFLIFYSKFPVISTTSISIALKQCEALISIAKPLGTVSVIRPYLGNAIARFGKQLYMAIVAEPFRWLELSMILESAAIFKESMIHIVGTYIPGPEGPGGQINLPADIPQFVRDLIIYKVRQLDQQRMDVNERLFSSSIVIDSKTVTFSFVDTAVFSTWLVVQIWRDWFCRQIAGVHLNPQKTGQLYRILAKSGDAYLTTAAVKAVIEKIRDPVKVELDELREDLELLKKFAQEAVKELCVNNSMVDVQEAGIYYLTCTRTMDEELPWFETEQ